MTWCPHMVTVARHAVDAIRVEGSRGDDGPSTTVAWARPLLWLKDLTRADGQVPLDEVQAILIVRCDGVGDVILAAPLMRELRRAHPHAHITLVVAPFALNLVQECPYADRVLAVCIPSAVRWWHPLSRRFAALSSLAIISGPEATTLRSCLAGGCGLLRESSVIALPSGHHAEWAARNMCQARRRRRIGDTMNPLQMSSVAGVWVIRCSGTSISYSWFAQRGWAIR